MALEWLDDIISKGQDKWNDADWGQITSFGLSYLAGEAGLTGTQSKPMGYQGKVEKQTPIRRRLTGTAFTPNRRPGSSGRRYFTGTKFIKGDPDAASDQVSQAAVLDESRQVLGTDVVPDTQYGTRKIVGDFVPDVRLSDNVVVDKSAPVLPENQDSDKTYTPEGYLVVDEAAYDPAKETDAAGYQIEETGLRPGSPTDYTAEGKFILAPDLYDETKQYGTEGDFAGYEIISPSQRDETKEYTDEGYEILDTAAYDPDLDYDVGTGFQITTPAEYYTNRQVAEDAQATEAGQLEARNLALSQMFNPQGNKAGGQIKGYNVGGGIKQLAGGRYLDGMTDGMADRVPASIEGSQPAALSDGEFVIPADVVSHLGNGSSNAGAKVLDEMMSNVRKQRTGNPKQGKQINPKQVMAQGGIAGYANGGRIQKFQEGGTPKAFDDFSPEQTGQESSLSSWAGDYVTGFLGKAEGLADQEYEAYEGPLTAGPSELQDAVFTAAGDLDTSGASLGSFGDLAQETTYNPDGSVNVMGRDVYMNPYLEDALAPQIRAAEEQAAIAQRDNAARMAQSGAFGGSRQAIMDAMMARDTAQNIADIRNQGYSQAFQSAQDAFGRDRDFGLQALQAQSDLGQIQRDITAEGVAADKEQFEEERDFQYKMPQWLHSLTQGLPLAATNYSYSQPSALSQLAGGAGGLQALYQTLFPSDED
jgi:hypothetical protein